MHSRTSKRGEAATKRVAALRLLGLICISAAGFLLLGPHFSSIHRSGDQLEASYATEGGLQSAIHYVNFGLRGDTGPTEGAGASGGSSGDDSGGDGQHSKQAQSRSPWEIDPSKHVLTKEMAEAAATGVDGVTRSPVVITWANAHFLDFVENWVAHINATGCRHNYLVGALDTPTLAWLVDNNIPSFAMATNFTSGGLNWGSSAFFDMGIEKIRLIRQFVRWGVDVFVLDVDAVILGCPLDFFAHYPQADFLVSTDALKTSLAVEDAAWNLEPPHVAASSVSNIGVILVRSSPPAVKLVEEWVSLIEKDRKYWDQNAFNDLWWQGFSGGAPIPEHLVLDGNLLLGYNGTVKVGTLPMATFCSGHTFFVDRLPQRAGLHPYVVHNTFVFSEAQGKRHRFREGQIWRPDGPDYMEGQYVLVDNPIPKDLETAAALAPRGKYVNFTVPHFNLVNYQLTNLRALFGAATALGRGAVLPQLWCGLDNWWWPHDGVIPGSNTNLPFECPVDHVLNIFAMLLDLPAHSHGPAIPFRESTFLRKFSTEELRNETVVVRTCGPDGPPEGAVCADGSGPAVIHSGEVWLRPGLTDAQLFAALGKGSPAARYKFLVFKEAAALWGGFVDADAAARFKGRLDEYASLWCCSEPEVQGGVGHVWYDLFWDQEHTDRWGREWGPARPWEPTMGPLEHK